MQIKAGFGIYRQIKKGIKLMELIKLISKRSFWEETFVEDKHFFIPLIVTSGLVATSFAPLIQVILVELAYLYTPIASLLNIEVMPAYFLTNSVASAIILYQFYRTKSEWGIIFTSGVAVIFLYPILIYLFRGLGRESLHMVPFILAALGYGVSFLTAALFRRKVGHDR